MPRSAVELSTGLLLLAACGSHDTPSTPAAKNLVVIVLDTLRPDHLGCYGYERGTSPHLDAFADDALVFENAQSAAPWTAPALHSLMTGLHPSVHGIQKYPNPGHMNESVVTLAEILREHGYGTAALTEGGYARAQFGLGQGFDHFPESEAFQKYLDGRVLDRDRLTAQVGDALDWLHERGTGPFFLFFHTYRPHIPWDAPEEIVQRFRPDFDEAAEHADLRRAMAVWNEDATLEREDWFVLARHLYHCNLTAADPARERERFNEMLDVNSRVSSPQPGLAPFDPELVSFVVDLYDAAVSHTDAEIQRLWTGLSDLGRDADTLVVIVSDHGEGLGEHERMQHGKVLHEEALRIVLLVRVPSGPLAGGRRVPDLVRSVDVMPTLLELLGVDTGQRMNGRSLVDLLSGEPDERWAISQSLNKMNEEESWISIRTGRWRYVWDRVRDTGALYDRETDSLEVVDVKGRHPEVVQHLRTLLERQVEADIALRRVVSGEVEWNDLDESVRRELEGLGYTE